MIINFILKMSVDLIQQVSPTEPMMIISIFSVLSGSGSRSGSIFRVGTLIFSRQNKVEVLMKMTLYLSPILFYNSLEIEPTKSKKYTELGISVFFFFFWSIVILIEPSQRVSQVLDQVKKSKLKIITK